MFSFLNLFLFFSLLQLQQQQVKTESNGTACASDSSTAPPGSYKLTVLKNDSCACGVVHEEIDTITIRVVFKIIKEGDGRTIVVTAVVQSTASGALLSIDTVVSVNGVSDANTAFTAAMCKIKAVPRLVSYASLYLFHLLNTGILVRMLNLTSKYLI